MSYKVCNKNQQVHPKRHTNISLRGTINRRLKTVRIFRAYNSLGYLVRKEKILHHTKGYRKRTL